MSDRNDVPSMQFAPGDRVLRRATGLVYRVRNCVLQCDGDGRLYWDYLLEGFNETSGRKTYEYVPGAQLAEAPE